MNTRKFRGAGLNAAGMLVAVNNANNSLSRKTLPAGATWPFATLSIGNDEAIFRMPSVCKRVSKQDVIKIELSKYGYVFFHTRKQANDFGFTTLRLQTVLHELRQRDYPLAESCRRNATVARLFVFLFITFAMLIVIMVTVLSILKQHGL